MPVPRLPTGPGAERWRTRDPLKTVLAVVHTVTSAIRLTEILAAFESDARIQTVFTVTGSSPFASGVDDYLRHIGASVLPWAEAVEQTFDLAVTAAHGGALADLLAPVITFPHGVGYNKLLEPSNHRTIEPSNHRPPVYGLSKAWLSPDGALVPDTMVLSSDEQLARLRRYHPPAADIAVIAGDPVLDRLHAGAHLRDAYRAALGVEPDQRLILLSSTWGRRSLDGRSPDLPLRLAADLPTDRYPLALALHPNVWYGHSPWQVRSWTAECRRAGVRLLPPEEGWQAAVVAADLVVGDHGSVMFYAAAAGRPVLFAPVDPVELDPASPMARLLRAAPRLASHERLRPQVEAVIADPRRDEYAAIADEATSVPGRSAALIRALLYERLRLPEPAAPARTPIVPMPRLEPPHLTASIVSTSRVGGAVAVERFPADLRLPNPPDGDTHLSVAWDHDDPQLLPMADVVVARADVAVGPPRRWIRSVLKRLPGCTLAVVAVSASDVLIGVRNGPMYRARSHHRTPDAACVAAGALAVLADGPPAAFTLLVGARRYRIRLTPVPLAPARHRTRRAVETGLPDH